MAPKYTIGREHSGELRLFATHDIEPGEEILAEKQIDSVVVGLKDSWDDSRLFDNMKKYNVQRHLETKRDQMSNAGRDILDRLPIAKPQNGFCGIWKTNAYEVIEHIGGLPYSKLVLFRDLSRVGHSCRPNAVWRWNDARGVGTLYEIGKISAESEITMELLAESKYSLRESRLRNEDLSDQWNISCKCGACIRHEDGVEKPNEDDEALRTKAASRLSRLMNNRMADDETAAQHAVRRLKVASKYTGALIQLNIKDIKLSNAYSKLATWHEKSFDSHTLQSHRRCKTCLGGAPVMHIKGAIDALNEEEMIIVRCSGTDHPDLADVDTRQRGLQLKLSRA